MSDMFNAAIAGYDAASIARMSREEADAAMARLTSIYRDPNPPQPSAAARELTGADVDLFAPNAAEKLPGYVSTSGPHAMTPRQQLSDINTLRDAGLTDAEIRERYDENRQYPAELHQAAKARWKQLAGDPEFRRLLLSGDVQAARMWRAYATIVTGGIKAAA